MNNVIKDSFINSHLLELIGRSEKYLVLVSPYLKLWGHLETQIENSVKRGVDVQLWYRSDQEKKYKKTYDKLSKMGVKVGKIDTLHSKLYLSEKEGLMTSMNLLDFSKSNSREIGILTDERKMLNQFKDYIEDLTQKPIVPKKSFFDRGKDFLVNQLTDDTPTPQTDEPKSQSSKSQPKKKRYMGYCIRCSDSIPFNVDRPYCGKCFKSWNRYQDEEYEEEFCHHCSKDWETSFLKPVCLKCFKGLKKGILVD